MMNVTVSFVQINGLTWVRELKNATYAKFKHT